MGPMLQSQCLGNRCESQFQGLPGETKKFKENLGNIVKTLPLTNKRMEKKSGEEGMERDRTRHDKYIILKEIKI